MLGWVLLQSVESVVSKKSVVWEIVKENSRGIEECEPEFSLQRPERGWKNYGRNGSVYAKQNHCVFEAKVDIRSKTTVYLYQ